MTQDDHANEVRYALRVRPETSRYAWHATLEPQNQEHLEFDSPLELARHLANIHHSETGDRKKR